MATVNLSDEFGDDFRIMTQKDGTFGVEIVQYNSSDGLPESAAFILTKVDAKILGQFLLDQTS